MNASLADPSPFLLRAGTPTDLDTFVDIDNDAGALFVRAGFDLDLPDTHEFPKAERARWAASLAAGTALVATQRDGTAVGFIAVGRRDGEPFVEQLSVRMAAMRQGIGRTLLATAGEIERANGARRLWLSTYAHLPFNRPWYERQGFAVVRMEHCGADVLRTVAFERQWLPLPQERVVMRKALPLRL
jgi:GNAT superfamily N-acetyltransferase